MVHFTDNPVSDSINEIIDQDKKEYLYDYWCNGCYEGFDHGHGVEIQDEKFCNTCIDQNQHYEFYKECGLSAAEIYEVTNSAKDL